MNVEDFITKHLELLEVERNAEIEESIKFQESFSFRDLQNRGLCIMNILADSSHTGMYGRCLYKFEPSLRGTALPSHSFTSGDIAGAVLAGGSGREVICSGIVSRVGPSSITIAFDEAAEVLGIEENSKYHLLKLANDVTYKRLKGALQKLSKDRDIRFSNLVQILFGEGQTTTSKTSEFEFYNSQLDESQKEAVAFALSQKELAVIHGPPGTGKTTTLIEIILQLVQSRGKILACAPSNIAVDNLVERLSKHKIKIVRLGHPARVSSEINKFSFDAVLARSDNYQIMEDIRKEISRTLESAKKTNDKGQRQYAFSKRRELQKELRQREKKAFADVLRTADVVLSTLTSASDDGPLKYLPSNHFQVVVIDECSQALEAACWIALPRAPKCILAGDHLQLPPTIVSKQAADDGLSVTLMERLLKLHGEGIKKLLSVQYRMHETIMHFPSKQLYDGKLVAHFSVKNHLLRDLPGIQDNEDTCLPLVLIDTAGCFIHELETLPEDSKGNEGEANLVALHVEKLISSGLKPKEIAIISPYNLQVELIRLRLSSKYPELETRSVDGFQGREKEAVVISLVRSNKEGQVGFLAEDRRINVAITRARRHLAVICDSETVSHHPFLKLLIEYIMSHGEVHSAHQFSSDLNECSSLVPERFQQPKTVVKSKTSKKQDSKSEENRAAKRSIGTSAKKIESDSNSAENVESIKEVLMSFIADESRLEHNFPPTLYPFERRLVHEISEQLGLLHISQGEGTDRYITIKKLPTEARDVPEEQNQEDNCGIRNYDKLRDSKEDFVKNDEENEVNAEINKEAASNQGSQKQKSKPKPSKKNKTPKLKATVPVKDDDDDDDLDALIASVVKTDNTCAFGKCMTSLLVLCQTCQFCNRRFCCSHSLPEVHGCGDAAHIHARSQVRKEGKLYSGSGVPSRLPKPEKKAQLQKKLDKQLTELASNRKRKPKK